MSITEAKPNLGGLPESPFDLDMWLEERHNKIDYVMIELGHSDGPVATRQDFIGKRLYVGVEAWYYQSLTEVMQRAAYAVRSQKPDQNIVFINNPTGRTGYVGETYDPECILPAKVADEVFIGNVFGDPIISLKPERTDSLLGEAKRLIGQNGKIIIRETYTPNYAIVEDRVANAGLQVVARFDLYENNGTWSKLEELYEPVPNAYYPLGRPPHEQSFYLLLTEKI